MILLLSPQNLYKDGVILHFLEINKASKSPFAIKELSKKELIKVFSDLPKGMSEQLAMLGKAGLSKLKDELLALHAKQHKSTDLDSFMQSALLRKMHDTLAITLPATSSRKWYHRVQGLDGKVKTAPCSVLTEKPVLYFEVKKKGAKLGVGVQVGLNGTLLDLSKFNRYHFFLEQNNTYHLLGFKDYRILEWLQSEEVEKHGSSEDDFLKHVVLRLEATHKVNRNDLLNHRLIDTDPVCQAMISELSGSFLMITPQWLYDGVMIEGPFKETQNVLRGGNSYTVKRNREKEDHLVQLLQQLHSTFEKQRNGYFFLTFDEARKKQWFLKTYHYLLEQDVQLAGMDMLKHFRYSEHKPATEFAILEQNDNELRIRLKVSFGEEPVSLQKLQRILLGGQSHLLLKDDRIAILDEAWLQKYATIIRHGRIKGDELLLERWLSIAQHEVGTEKHLLKPVFNGDWWQDWERWQTADVCIPLPAALHHVELRPYQQKGYEWMVLLANAGAGACLADDMGLGKTLQTICFLANRLEKYPAAKHLVVCPSSLMYNWQQEFQKFAPDLGVVVYHGQGRKTEDLRKPDARIVITTYGTLRSDIDLLSEIAFCVAVLDESHNIKNLYALVTQAVSRIKARTRVALSGTPVMNNTFDLYSQLNFLLPGLFGSREFFKQQYSDPIDRDNDPVKTKILQKLTAPFILRRTKEQVASDLPEKTEQILWCNMGPMQMEQYEALKENIRSSVFLEIEREGLSKSRLSIIQGITRLRQACNSPLLLPNEDQIATDSVKTEVLIDELKNNLKEHKVLVFSQFTRMLKLLAEELERNNITCFQFDGQTPPKKRMEMVEAFQADSTQVFLISLMAGNAGLNLTAADYVFLFDPWWNTAVQQQAIDRTHRIGQKKNVFAYKMACRDTIEEKIILLQDGKKALADELIGGEEGFVKNLSLEDIEYLFR